MRQNPSVPIKIIDIIQTTEDGVLVQLVSGKVIWIPRNQSDFAPGHVILTPWMAAKINQTDEDRTIPAPLKRDDAGQINKPLNTLSLSMGPSWGMT